MSYLKDMLEMLTGAYNRRDVRNAADGKPMETNIGKLFATFSWGLDLVHEHSEKIRLWDYLENAQGAVLDRYGMNFGVSREGTPDAFYRLMIKVKMIAMLSGGDIDTVQNAAATLFDLEPSRIDLEEVFPAKVWLYVDEDLLTAEQIDLGDLVATLMKRIVAAGVGMRLFFRTYRQTDQHIYVNTGLAVHDELSAHPKTKPRTFRGTAYVHTIAASRSAVEACIPVPAARLEGKLNLNTFTLETAQITVLAVH